MSAGAAPRSKRPAWPDTAKGRPRIPEAGLRLPEDRAFQVSSINARLARMAAEAPKGAANS